MATDHRGKPLHAGKRTYDEMYNGLVDMDTRLDAARTFAHTPGTFDDGGDKMWDWQTGHNMATNAFDNPDTAHISLSTEGYR